MHRRRKIITYFGFGLFISFFLLSLFVIFQLTQLEKGIVTITSDYGYGAILAVSFLADMIMQPIGPDIPLIAGIVLGLNPMLSFIFAAAGSLAATALGYYLGSMYGEMGFMKFYGYSKYEKWRRYYEKYGKILVVVAALTPLPFVPICWISGIFNMNKIEFIIFGIGSRLFRFLGVMYITVRIIGM